MPTVPGVEVRASGLHGLGAFALRRFAAGEAVLAQEGLHLHASDVADHVKALQLGPALWLLADPEDPHPSDEVNHACAPNLGFLDGTPTLYALRSIDPGEELTFDYATCIAGPGWVLPCACGGPSCRGEIRGWVDLSSELRERLRPRALAWLREL